MSLWLVAALMTAAIVALLLWRRPAPGRTEAEADGDAARYDMAVYRDQLAEVERDVERGLIDPGQAEAARTEIARRMLAAAERRDGGAPAGRGRARLLPLALMVGLPLAALALYLPTGRPDLPSQPFAERDRSAQEERLTAVQEAEALARRLSTAPDDAAGWAELGQRYRDLGRRDDAVAAFARAVGLTGGDPLLTSAYGEALVEAGNGMVTEEAVNAFQSVLDRLPGEPRARFYLALARAQAGDDAGALERLRALAADSPADAPWLPVVHRQIVAAAERLGLDPEEQVPEPLPAGVGRPGPDAADIAAADTMSPEERAEMIRGMVDGLAARLSESPDDLDGWLRLGRAYQVLGQPEDAAAALGHAAALAPDNPAVLGAYGDALLETDAGRMMAPEFIAVMERLLALNENDVRALWFLGARALADERPDEAAALWRRLLDQLEPGTQAYQTVREFLAEVEPAEPQGAAE